MDQREDQLWLSKILERQRDADILFVAAAGNEFNDSDQLPVFPASAPLTNVSVAATTRRDERAGFSNFGRRRVHVGAPGEDVLSTLPKNRYGEHVSEPEISTGMGSWTL
jgi:thermitase